MFRLEDVTYLDFGEGFGEGCVDWFCGVHVVGSIGLWMLSIIVVVVLVVVGGRLCSFLFLF